MTYGGWAYSLCCKRYQCHNTSYKVSQLPLLFERLDRPEAAAMMRNALRSVSTTLDPGVPVHCIYNLNVQTVTPP
eukprot:NODE_20240_length_806_cov_6.802651.p2 GENE.NODE_20240_length_806_cov_6.802651~~NODE_20240_length_806_cov_6.802651.p2  ORF type:complete len:75 (+),score=13.38 NODE_20240_length_806_cov_6.802651:59-283(+)